MKRIIFALTALFMFGSALANSVEGGDEVWQRDTFESGESVYTSGVWGMGNINLMIGERGVGLVFMRVDHPVVPVGKYEFFMDDDPPVTVELVRGESTHMPTTIFKESASIANRLANAKKAKLVIRACKLRPTCYFALNGGDKETVTWFWKEPLTTTFPDFVPIKVPHK